MFGFHHCTKLFEFVLQQDWDDLLFRLEQYPNEAHHWETVQFDGQHETRLLPLHQVCALDPPLRVVEALLKAYPEATHKHDIYFHRVPLHIATSRAASAEVVKMVLAAAPGAAKQQDALGRVPLHYAVFSHDSLEIILTLIRTYPAGIKVMDYKGWLPIHVACRCGTTLPIMRALLESYPRSTLRTTTGGMTPLECAERFGVLNEECKALLRQITLERQASSRDVNENCQPSQEPLVPPEPPMAQT